MLENSYLTEMTEFVEAPDNPRWDGNTDFVQSKDSNGTSRRVSLGTPEDLWTESMNM